MKREGEEADRGSLCSSAAWVCIMYILYCTLSQMTTTLSQRDQIRGEREREIEEWDLSAVVLYVGLVVG